MDLQVEMAEQVTNTVLVRFGSQNRLFSANDCTW